MAFNKDKLLKSAERQVSKGRIEAAIKDYQKILAKAGEDPNILNRIGDLYKRLRKNPDAIRYWEKTADCYEKSGFYVKAIAVQKKIQRLDPSSLQVHRRLAELYHRQGLINDARSHYQHLVDHYLRQEEAASAIGIYQKMIELEPDDPGPRARLAELYRQQQLPSKAVTEYGQIAHLFVSHGEFDQAKMIYVRALELDASDPEFVRRGVIALRDAGRVDLAQEFLDAALPLNAETATFQSLIGGLRGGPPAEERPSESPAERPPESASAQTAASAADLDSTDPGQTLVASDHEPTGSSVPGAATGGFQLVDTGETDAAETGEVSEDSASDFSTFPPVDVPVEEVAAEAQPRPAEEVVPSETSGQTDDSEELGFEEFEIEFDDEPPASLVQPPPDMQESDSGLAFAKDETGQFAEIELDLESDLETGLESRVEPGRDTGGEAATPPPEARMEDGYEIEGVTFAEAEPGEPPVEPPGRAPVDEPAAAVDEIAFELEEFDLPSFDAPEVVPPPEPVAAEPATESTAGPIADSLPVAPPDEDSRSPSSLPSAGEAPPPPGIGDDWEMEPVGEAEEPSLEPPMVAPAASESTVTHEESEVAAAEIFLPEVPETVSPPAVSEPQELGVDSPPLPELVASAPPLIPPTDPSPAPSSVAPPPGVGLPPVEVPETVQRVNDLLAEAEVFVKYGLQEKAVDRLEEVLRLDPKHLGAATQLVRLQLERREHSKVAPLVNQLYLDVEETGAMELWGEIKQQLIDEGYGFEGEKVVQIPGAEVVPVDAQSSDIAAPAAQPPAADAVGGDLVDLQAIGAEIDRELGEEIDPRHGIEGDARPMSEEEISWLEPSEEQRPVEQELFEEEEQLFDLAAELQSELDMPQSPVAPEEQSLEQIIEGFKKGVSENLSPEDSDTHYNLGIAYREMMLLDEAIGEFQIAAKDPNYLVDSCAMLGLCFRDKGLPELALKWYRKGLDAKEIDENRALGMLYDVADIYAETEDRAAAYSTFVEIYGMNTNYRDVATRMEELAPS